MLRTEARHVDSVFLEQAAEILSVSPGEPRRSTNVASCLRQNVSQVVLVATSKNLSADFGELAV